MNIPKPFTKREQRRSQSSLKRSPSSLNKNQPQSCINMEELMQFEAARQRALAQVDPSVKGNPFSEFVPHRIFVNQIDTFNGSHIAKYLCNVAMSLQKEDQGESDYEEEDTDFNDEQGIPEDDEYPDDFTKETDRDTYEVIGSLEFYNNPQYRRPEGIFEVLDNEKKAEFLDKLLTCGFIIYDITSDVYCHPKQVEEAKWVLESIVKRLEIVEKNQPQMFAKYTHCRVFILISTLLTWAKTKPIDPGDPSLPFTERDYRKRKPHPNYKIHCELEKRVIELGKRFPNNLKTIVIGSGLPYGYEEDIFHFLFKMAWLNAPFLPIFRPGDYMIPVIHIDSLASIVHVIIENFPRKYKYIIATDPHSVTLKQIVKLLAKNLGNGKTKLLNKEEAFLFPDIKQRNYDMLSASINIVPGCIMDNMILRWGTTLPFAENIKYIISQFKTARGLAPIKIFIHGPPASGKSVMAKRLSVYYDIPYLSEKGMVEDTINTLKEKIKAKTENKEEKPKHEKINIEGDEEDKEEAEDEDEEEEDLETLTQTLRRIEENMEKNDNKKLDEEFILRFFKEKLSSNACKNKGYVIDGYPETIEQTKILYAPEANEEGFDAESAEEEQGGDISQMCNVTIMPVFVESLDASDEYLINKMIKLPNVNMTEFEEHDMCRRLTEFRALNTEDNTPLIFYDEMDVHPMIYNMENDPDPHMKATFQAIINHIGPPKNYAQEIPPLEELFAEQEDESRLKHMEDLKSQRDEAAKVAEERRQNMEKWMFLKNQELEAEEKAFLLMGMPLRHYLMRYIFPCLTRGLVEVARIRPDDPVDFLSEFLFRENPEGKMFQPDYDEREEKLSEALREYEMMRGQRTPDSKGSKRLFSTEKSAQSDAVSKVTDYKCSFVTREPATTYRSGSRLSDKSRKGSSLKSLSSTGVCTCGHKSPSLSTCSSDRTPSTASSCVCPLAEPCEPCEPCDTSEEEKEKEKEREREREREKKEKGKGKEEEEEEKKKKDPCKCPCI